MSTDRDPFERSSEEELSSVDRVLGFLATNDDGALKARTIAREIELDVGAVSTALTRLKSGGLVEHKGTYWAVTSDERRLASHEGYARATAVFNEQFGEEDREEWKEHAPDEPHPSVADEDQ
ncbi:MarR family transcriptional regulator [Natrarchaeobius oligotrophus]|uniref:MarR family transcriptional regulator n=1 Tax=Natrarchaeobius chitinivorans TaxID=1679083 RepID=A0A3N6M9P1_NATCH|nr:helix-turn-helix domain-containing protein [Natrarchaeobius chitinivorans]RQH00504.1 MarR family transcriptional regulator [Natrarchaeobius chitinivorans]